MHLPLHPGPVRRARLRLLALVERRPLDPGEPRPGADDGRRRRHRDQHRPRAWPQARQPRALAEPRSPWRRPATATSSSSTTAATTSASPLPRTRRARGWGRASGPSCRAPSPAACSSAWGIECARLDRMGKSHWSLRNDILGAWAMTVVLFARAGDRLRPGRPALPAAPGGARLLAARGRQLPRALRPAAPEARGRPLRALPSRAQLEQQQRRLQRPALPPAAPQRPPRQPDPALPGAAPRRRGAAAAHRLRRDDRARLGPAALAAGDGPAPGRALRRRPQPRQHPAAASASASSPATGAAAS